MNDYINEGISLLDRPEFYEATAEELRVLLVIKESGKGLYTSELAKWAGVSHARAASALTYWESAGLLEKNRSITTEFSDGYRDEDLWEMKAADAAKAIRDEGLAALIEECAKLLERPALSSVEIKQIVELRDQYALSDEYIVTLLTDLCSRSDASVRALCRVAVKYYNNGIETADQLNAYITERDEKTDADITVKSALGLHRKLTKTESGRANKWVKDFGYGREIILTAYDLAPHDNERGTWTVMDNMLTLWHENHLRTEEECRTYYAAHKPTFDKKITPKKKDAPRQGNFDPEDAFRRALERSYGEDK